jgi:hypothetical protein
MQRLASEKEAAAYFGFDLATFRARVASGHFPRPLPDCNKYDLKAIDAALDLISGLSSATTTAPLDRWRAKKSAG